MNAERQVVLSKVTQFLNNEISQEEIYTWALEVAVSKEYEELSKQDPLLKETIETLLMMQHPGFKVVPTRKAIEYYRRCLSGDEQFIPLKERKDLDKLKIPDEVREVIQQQKEKQSLRGKVFLLMRIYVLLFGLAVLGVYAFSILKGGLAVLGAEPTSKLLVWEPILYMLYALIIILPLRFTAKGILFYFTFPIVIIGMVYFWSIPVRLFQSVLLILLALPLSGIPATLAVILFARQKEQQK
jgi:hypothetical protein